MKGLCNICFYERDNQIFMEATKPRELDTEGRGSTFPQIVCIY